MVSKLISAFISGVVISITSCTLDVDVRGLTEIGEFLGSADESVFSELHRRANGTWCFRMENVVPDAEVAVILNWVKAFVVDAKGSGIEGHAEYLRQRPWLVRRLPTMAQWIEISKVQLNSGVAKHVEAQFEAYWCDLRRLHEQKNSSPGDEKDMLALDIEALRGLDGFADALRFDMVNRLDGLLGGLQEEIAKTGTSQEAWFCALHKWHAKGANPPLFYEAFLCGLVLRSYGLGDDVTVNVREIRRPKAGYSIEVDSFRFEDDIWVDGDKSRGPLGMTLGQARIWMPKYPVLHALIGVREHFQIQVQEPALDFDLQITLMPPGLKDQDQGMQWVAFVARGGVVIGKVGLYRGATSSPGPRRDRDTELSVDR